MKTESRETMLISVEICANTQSPNQPLTKGVEESKTCIWKEKKIGLSLNCLESPSEVWLNATSNKGKYFAIHTQRLVYLCDRAALGLALGQRGFFKINK